MNLWSMVEATINSFIEDRAMTRGAAIAYYTTFSLAPMLGAAGVEYGILVAAISVGIVAVSFVLGGYVAAAFDTVRDEFVAEGLQADPD